MRWKQGAKAVPARNAKSGAQSTAGPAVDHLLQAAGGLEIAEAFGRQPFEIVVLVVQDRLVAGQRAANDMIR